jgi:hypothetical protein
MKRIITWIKKYIEFTVGVIFGASVATIVSYFIFSVIGGDVDVLRLLQIQSCLLERII